MTANTSQLARLFQLMTSVADLVIRGSRDAEKVSAVLQRIKENPNFDEVSAGTVARSGKGVSSVRWMRRLRARGAILVFPDHAYDRARGLSR